MNLITDAPTPDPTMTIVWDAPPATVDESFVTLVWDAPTPDPDRLVIDDAPTDPAGLLSGDGA